MKRGKQGLYCESLRGEEACEEGKTEATLGIIERRGVTLR